MDDAPILARLRRSGDPHFPPNWCRLSRRPDAGSRPAASQWAIGRRHPGLGPSASPAADGERLFGLLFADEALRKAWAEVRGANKQRRIRLRIDPHAPKLHTVPWELLREPKAGTAHAHSTWPLTSRPPFSRYLDCGESRPAP